MQRPLPGSSPPVTNITLAAGQPTTGGFSTDADQGFDRTVVMKVPGTGMTVFGRYKLQRILGRGGMGVVWLADDLKLERPVALKFLPSLIGLDPAAVKELKTETRRGLELSHPNIVRIYDFVDDDDAAAISMEFVDGKTLSELRLTTEHGVFTTEEISRWLLGVCDALDYAHFQRKLVHRDLKPANIMLAGNDLVAKVADFGIARSLSDTMSRLSAANMGGASGTLPYMSPQQAMGERPLPTDDVYSLGATLYELLSGKPPFYRGDLPMQIRSKIAPTIMERRQELEISGGEPVPKLWEDAIAACLHKEPHERPSCAGALAEMLQLKPSTVSARTMSFPSTRVAAAEAPKSGTKSWMPAAAAVVALGGVAAWYATSRPEAVVKPSETPVVKSTSAKAVEATPKKAEPSQDVAAAKDSPKKVESEEKKAPEVVPAPSAAKPPASVATAEQPPSTPPTMAEPAAPPATMAAAPTPAASPLPASTPAVMGSAALPTTEAKTLASVAMLPPNAMSAQLPGEQKMVPTPPVIVPPAFPLPPGVVLPPEVIAQVNTQPVVEEPSSGFWTVEQMYPTLPFANYSSAGKNYLLYRTQTLLKEKGLYNSVVDGKEGKGTHTALQLFQAKNGLKLTGMLDVPTLAALQLSAEPDNSGWSSPVARRSSSGSKSSKTKDEPNFLERTGSKLKGLFGN